MEILCPFVSLIEHNSYVLDHRLSAFALQLLYDSANLLSKLPFAAH